MLIASTCLVVFVLTVLIRSLGQNRPLDRHDVHRVRRFAERSHREESLPFE